MKFNPSIFLSENNISSPNPEFIAELNFIQDLLEKLAVEMNIVTGYDTMGIIFLTLRNPNLDFIQLDFYTYNFLQITFIDKLNQKQLLFDMLKSIGNPEFIHDIDDYIILNTNKIELNRDALETLAYLIDNVLK